MPRKKAATEAAAQAQTLSRQLDKDLAAKAYKKVMSGEVPTTQERDALRRYERDQEEQRRWQYYQTIPQKHWREMSGRQTKVINEQADRYALPFGGRTVHLPNFVRAFHDFLARNAHKLNQGEEDFLVGESSPALERYREERARLAKLDRLQREGVLVDVAELHEGVVRVAAIVRRAGDVLQRAFGAGAVEILNEALDEAEREIERAFARSSVLEDQPE